MTMTNIANHKLTRRPTPAARGRLEPIHWGSLSSLPKREPLIEGLIDIGTLSAIVGATSSYKTGIALDLACHVALGRKWRGHTVRQGSVLYLAAEGVGPRRLAKATKEAMTMRMEWLRAGDNSPACGACFIVFDGHVDVLAVIGPKERIDRSMSPDAARALW